MSTTSQSGPDECVKYVRGLLADEIRYRRDRQWNIFSWSSSLLLGLIGGIIALAGASGNFELTSRHRGVLTITILVLSGWAFAWIVFHSEKERQLGEAANTLDEKPLDQAINVEPDKERKNIKLNTEGFAVFRGYTVALLMIATLAVATVYFYK